MPHITATAARRRLALLACCLSIFLAGCPTAPEPAETTENLPPAGTSIKLAVVDDPALADAVEQLRGEWQAQAGFTYEVVRTSRDDLLGEDSPPADAAICPAHLLGSLARKEQLLPVPEVVMEGELEEWSSIFSLLRAQEASWKGQAVAVPFGSPVLVCYYRADLLEELGRDPPTTWKEYQELAELLADREKLGEAAPPAGAPFSATAEPLGPGWAGIVLLARAAPYATHRSSYSTLFNINSMEPMIAGPAYVRALEELVAAAKLGSPQQLELDPHKARAEFWAGRSAMALSWPTAAALELPDVPEGLSVGLAELPGAEEVYGVNRQEWEAVRESEESRVPLLATGGRLGVVSAGCRWPEAVFRLLAWLSGDRWSPRLCSTSPATTIFRESHVNSPAAWAEKPIPPGVAAEYAALTEQTFRRQRRLICLRIPGREEYLTALDKAVHAAVEGDQTPQAALNTAASQWSQITERLGSEEQLSSYRDSLGLD